MILSSRTGFSPRGICFLKGRSFSCAVNQSHYLLPTLFCNRARLSRADKPFILVITSGLQPARDLLFEGGSALAAPSTNLIIFFPPSCFVTGHDFSRADRSFVFVITSGLQPARDLLFEGAQFSCAVTSLLSLPSRAQATSSLEVSSRPTASAGVEGPAVPRRTKSADSRDKLKPMTT